MEPSRRHRAAHPRLCGSRTHPDVSLLHRDTPREQVTTTPPLLCIEILSREDRLPRVRTRLDNFLAMGVQHVWLIDPTDRVTYTYSGNGLFQLTHNRLDIPGTAIYLDLPTLFAALD